MGLNELGYEHFTVVHKTTFKQRYQNVDTGETVDCNTNRIEGAWKICKGHFSRINGSNTSLFEQHIAEIVWRNHVHKDNLYEAFFSSLKNVYSLSQPPKYTYRKHLFDTWTPPGQRDELEHHITIVQESDTDSESPSEADNEDVDRTRVQSGATASATANKATDSEELSDQPIPLSASTPASIPPALSVSDSPQPSTSITDRINDRFVTKRMKKVSSQKDSDWEVDTGASGQQAHPTNFLPMKRKEKKKSKSAKTKKSLLANRHIYLKCRQTVTFNNEILIICFVFMFHISVPVIHYFCNITEAEGEVWIP